MKRPLLGMIVGFGAVALGYSATAYGYVGYYGYGVELSGTGALAAHSGQTTLYAVNPGNSNGDVIPTGSTATYDPTDWTASSTATTPTYNLGTFNPLAGNSLILDGGSILTYSGSPDSVDTSSVTQYYVITPVGGTAGSPTSVALPLDVTDVDSAPGNDRFATESDSVNLLSGLSSGTYELSTYGVYTYDSEGGLGFANNGGNNYGALFTVATPEPASLALISLSGLAMLRRRRMA